MFLEQWIDYHILLGFDKFYLYDNSKVQIPGGGTITDKKNIISGKVNKYKVNYGEIVKLSNKEIQDKLLFKKQNVIQNSLIYGEKVLKVHLPKSIILR